MKNCIAAAAIAVLFCAFTLPVLAQREVDSNDLKISPAKYRNASVVVRDIFINRRAGIPVALTESGYTLDKYISFGLREAGIWCFLRRTTENEQLIGQLQNGQRITVRGTVRQPKVRVERGRFGNTHKLDLYLLEANQLDVGWE